MPDSSALAADDRRSGFRTYAETVARGFYGKHQGGTFGKHDNVRTYWEDPVTRVALRPFVRQVEAARAAAGHGVRVLDLGSGSGEGYQLLTHIAQRGLTADVALQYVLPSDRLSAYMGLDLSEAMVVKGRENYAHVEGVSFHQADLRDGLGPAASEEPFDIYFSSYAALSHLDAGRVHRLLVEIARHAAPGAFVVLDLVGRFSPEWPLYWGAVDDAEKVRPYSMSYLYGEAERRAGAAEQFLLRYWSGQEVRDLCRGVSAEAGVRFEVAAMLDRSIFVGRHTDTGEYGTALPPLRRIVNRLFELDVRTHLEDLRLVYEPVAGFDEQNEFLTALALSWRTLIDFTLARLRGERVELVTTSGWSEFPAPLQIALMNMDRVIDSVAWITVGDVRANIIEPQLGYVLRGLERGLQRGLGCGHGLLAIVPVGEPA